jgi:hypothetical protein
VPVHNVLVHKSMSIWVAALAVSWLLVAPNPVLAYVGPGAGLELLPYFLALLAWAGTALAAVFFWPLSALIRRLKGKLFGQRLHAADPPKVETPVEPAAGVPEATAEAADKTP